MNPNKTDVIKLFLSAKTHADLALLYNHDMEVQVNVAQEQGQKINQGELKGKGWIAYTDGVHTWKPFRIPINANKDAFYTDSPMTYSLELYADGIGMTGWDWKNKVSRWVAFDFDAIIGHSDAHSKKLSDTQLHEIQRVVTEIPFVTLRKSTSGKGLHLYVFLDEVPTDNHNEHSALARSILSMLSGLTSFDFANKVDVCGGNMWVWHRKMYADFKGNVRGDGLQLLKTGEQLRQVPANWRDHLNVVTHKTRKSVPNFVYDLDSNDPDKLFAELTGQRNHVNLDQDHKKLIDWLSTNNCVWWWDQDHHMLVTHTYHLKEAHTALKFRGRYETIASGSDRGFDHNCFAFPLRNGAWAVRRFSQGTKEADTWEQDGNRWTRCFYNREPDLHTLARLNDGIELEKGGYSFRHADSVMKVLCDLGIPFSIPSFLASRKASIKPLNKENKLVVTITAESNDDATKMHGWLNEKGKEWKRVFNCRIINNDASESNQNFDDLIRHLITSSDQDAGWVLKREDGWTEEPLAHIRAALGALGHDNKESNQIVGSSVMKAWTLVNKPFQPEYPGNREWNRGAAQFAIAPSQELDNLCYPTWTKVLQHCGQGLDVAIKEHEWCKSNNITTGAEFLMLWVSSLFKRPEMPMTYLAFWGPQDSGKSIFHEMISEILVTNGVMRADNALKSQQNFNGELASAVLCVVEETDLKKDKIAYNRIKDWVTSPQIMIRPLHIQGYMIRNCTHWIQCVPKSTWIQTISGPRQVADLINKFVTIVKDGKEYKTDGFFPTGKKQLIKIETNEGYTLECTDNHLIQTSFNGLKLWIEAGKLTPGSKICLNNHSNIEWSGDSNYDEGYILGCLFGDGWFRTREKDSPTLLFCKDLGTIPYICSILNDCTVLKQRNDRYTISGKQLKQMCHKLNFYKKDDLTNLELMSSDFYKGFISALIDTDGCVSSKHHRVVIAQSNKKHLQIIQRMLLRLGITSTIYKKSDGGPVEIMGIKCNSKTSYQLEILKKSNLEKVLKKCPPRLLRKFEELNLAIYNRERSAKEVEYVATVNNISNSSIEDTYDITVPDVHAFDANGISVHNCSNEQEACPVFVGDTRMTLTYVPALKEIIPKPTLMQMLRKEAPDFLAALLAMELPESNTRLAVPTIETESKRRAIEKNFTMLEQFICDEVKECDGHAIPAEDFHDHFQAWLDDRERSYWTKMRVGRELPERFPRGRLAADQRTHYGNMTLDKNAQPLSFRYTAAGSYLRRP